MERRRKRSHGAFNIIPEDTSKPHASLKIPEVKVSILSLRRLGGLRWPNSTADRRTKREDVFDWLQEHFRFQADNVRNQRENLILILANTQMRLYPDMKPHELSEKTMTSVLKRLTENYTSWCSFHHKESNLLLQKERADSCWMEILFSALFLLVWGEAANLRFMPECLSYIFHHLALEMVGLVTNSEMYQASQLSSSSGTFLENVVQPLYNIVSQEANMSEEGHAPHHSWRNYDDMNEYFWSSDCFNTIKWPLDTTAPYFTQPGHQGKVGKTGFVEQRSFLNIFRAFDRVWLLHILMLQALVLLAFEAGDTAPWTQLVNSQDTVATLLSVFITWAAMGFFFALVDIMFQWRLALAHFSMALRMGLKAVVAAAWIVIFSILYLLMWNQRKSDTYWSTAAQTNFRVFLGASVVFLLPQLLGLVTLLLPWLGRAIEKSNWTFFRLLTWWFQSSTFIGRGLYESTLDTIMYTAFWVLLLAVKFIFTYYLQIVPLVEPTKQLWTLTVTYTFPKFDSGHNVTAVLAVWAPAVLVYLFDLQIWYTVLSAVVGLVIGLWQHIGEIRTVAFLWKRFMSLPRAVQFNLVPIDSGMKRKWFTLWIHSIQQSWQKFTLRYQMFSSSHVPAPDSDFQRVWNGIIENLRKEDLISNKEMELLEVPQSPWTFSVSLWPASLLSNEVVRAMHLAVDWTGRSESLVHKVTRKEIRRCAVTEVYETLKHILEIVVTRAREKSMQKHLLDLFDSTIRKKDAQQAGNSDVVLLTDLQLQMLPRVLAKLVAFLDSLLKLSSANPPGSGEDKVVKALQDLHEVVVRDLLPAKTQELLATHGVVPTETDAADTLLYNKALQIPPLSDSIFYWHVRRLRTLLTTTTPTLSVPANIEARRRITFFCNSMFMDLPRPPSLRGTRAFCVLTPFYRETVSFRKKDLQDENEDGISILYYLQQIFPDEWKHMMERVGISSRQLWTESEGSNITEWASYRGQTLMRTVRGIMYNRQALEILASLEASTPETKAIRNPSSTDFETGSLSFQSGPAEVEMEMEELNPGSRTGRREIESTAQISALCDIKFQYIVACQVYGEQKKAKDPSAAAILQLLKQYPSLRVAYVDRVIQRSRTRAPDVYYSVLVKWDPVSELEQEVYRVRLPGPMKLGEGKPENQNHALIFSRGDYIQTIDMNQDNYLEETLKMRNLLEEFGVSSGVNKRRILGLREHVFTGGVSSLASFMSAQETAFVTLGQRVLACPLKIRMHYGHPDVFDRLWFLTRGGLSKASSVINLSEDIFAGFNCTLRGGAISHHEYIQVGKGRDVGLSQIASFEAKVACGNGEQTLSRDVNRLGQSLDFFRMLSFYYTSVGFFMSTFLTALTVYAFLWGRCYLALSGVEASLELQTDTSQSLTAVLNQQAIVQLGLLSAFPMVMEATLEQGFMEACWEFLLMQLQLASVFFTFSLGTRAHYFSRTIMHGGAKYRATGRGFVVRHQQLGPDYRFYSRSHILKGFELILMLIIYQTYTSLSSGLSYYLLTISCWFLALSWILTPCAFNPSGLDWLKLVEDWKDIYSWLWYPSGPLVTSDQSWEVWWYAEMDHLRHTGAWGIFLEAVLSLRFFLFQYAIIYQLSISGGSTSLMVYVYSWAYFLVAAIVYFILDLANRKLSFKGHLMFRAIEIGVATTLLLLIILALFLTQFSLLDVLASMLVFLPTGWGILLLMQLLLAVFPSLQRTRIWNAVIHVARTYEMLFIVAIFLPMAILSWLPGVQDMQTRILFNSAFSRGLQLSRILGGRKGLAE